MKMKPLIWSENFPPNKDCSYDHCYALTQFGRFLMTWKSWKSEPWQDMGIGFDETPWDDVWYENWSDLDEAKSAAEKALHDRITAMIEE